jgi:uncharacterized protein (UPF0548 family)
MSLVIRLETTKDQEERFLIEWDHADDSVWYGILASSRPRNVLLP